MQLSLAGKAGQVTQNSQFLRLPLEIRTMILLSVLCKDRQIHINNEPNELQITAFTKLHWVCRQLYNEVYMEKLFLKCNTFTFHTAQDFKIFLLGLTEEQIFSLQPVTISFTDCFLHKLDRSLYLRSLRDSNSLRGPDFSFLSIHSGLRHLKIEIEECPRLHPFHWSQTKSFEQLISTQGLESIEITYQDVRNEAIKNRDRYHDYSLELLATYRMKSTPRHFERRLINHHPRRGYWFKASIVLNPRKDATIWDTEERYYKITKTKRLLPRTIIVDEIICGIIVGLGIGVTMYFLLSRTLSFADMGIDILMTWLVVLVVSK